MSFGPQDPALRQLYKQLVETLEARINSLAQGSSISHGSGGHIDAIATAIRYKSDVQYIQALQEVIGLCEQIDRQAYGATKNNEDDD